MGIFSCQKQIDWGMGTTPTNNTGGGTTGGGTTDPNGLVRKTLIKAVTGNDSSSTTYFYDANSKIISTRLVAFNFGTPSNLFSGYERNSAGLIIRTKTFDSNSANPFAVDTAVTNYYYTTGSSPKLTYSSSTQDFMGIISTDSTVFTYNSAGYIAKKESYVGGTLSPVPTLNTRLVYTYDATGNCTKVETYSITGGVATLGVTVTINYDSKPLPQALAYEEAAIFSAAPSNKNNPIKSTINASIGGVTNNSVITDTYTYNSSNRPSGGTRVQTTTNFGTVNSTLTIIYQ
jgi:hypothetical protein